MLETRHPGAIVTKVAMVERDIDLLSALAERVAKQRSDLFVAPRRPSAQGDLFD